MELKAPIAQGQDAGLAAADARDASADTAGASR